MFVNVGRGEAATWLETGEALFAAMGKERKIEFVDMPEQLRTHYQNYTCADLTTLHSLGLTQPFLTLRKAFQPGSSRNGCLTGEATKLLHTVSRE